MDTDVKQRLAIGTGGLLPKLRARFNGLILMGLAQVIFG